MAKSAVAVVGGGVVGSFIALNLSRDRDSLNHRRAYQILGGMGKHRAHTARFRLTLPKIKGHRDFFDGCSARSPLYGCLRAYFWARRWLSEYKKASSIATSPEATALCRRMATESLKEIETHGQRMDGVRLLKGAPAILSRSRGTREEQRRDCEEHPCHKVSIARQPAQT